VRELAGRGKEREPALAAEQDPADEHSAEVAEVAHVARAEEELDEEQERDEVERLDRDRRKIT
jgi:hypothetical protein